VTVSSEIFTAPDIPEKLAFGEIVCPQAPDHRCVGALRVALARMNPEAGLASRLTAIERLGRWICVGPLPPRNAHEEPAIGRLALLVEALDLLPAARARVAGCFDSVLRETSGVKLFAEAGVPNDRGLSHETADRLARRFLPTPPNHGDLGELMSRIFVRERDVEWITQLPLELLTRLGAQLGDIWGPVREAMIDSIALVCTRVSALGLSEEIRERSTQGPLRESPFFRLPRTPLLELPAVMLACRAELGVVHHKLESTGVSVDVVYGLDTIGRCLDRIAAILPLVQPEARAHPAAMRKLLAILAAAPLLDQSLKQLLSANIRLLARKVIERAGETGEHYVTATSRGYWRMMASAAGGGALTTATCAIKFFTKWGHFPLFIDGALSAVNYAASFVVMQILGFTLATKQPSMTAAAIAGTIRTRGSHRLDDLVTMIARIARSQFAAALGNVGTVVIVAFGTDFLYMQVVGEHFLDPTTAEKTIASFHPFDSGVIFFAALTGVLLWISSLGAGWLENWVVYRRLPEALAHSPRLTRVFGRQRMARFSRFFAHNISGFGGSITLGILLGMTPVLGVFFGLPLNVAHVTLSSGALTFAGCAVGPDGLGDSFQWACGGIAVIGLLNFGVSFALALGVAFRAREVSRREALGLAIAVVRRLVRSPGEFFYPTSKALARDLANDQEHGRATTEGGDGGH
jgi:site-specific recombinase